MRRRETMALALACLCLVVPAGFAGELLGAAAPGGQPESPATASLPQGYLARDQLPDSLALLPPPPGSGSGALQRDEEARSAVADLRGSTRWRLAASDADLSFPHAPAIFSCAAGVPIGPDTTPRLYALLGKALVDVGLSTYGAKNKYVRQRPFVVHSNATCSPADEAALRKDGSYPSGHSAIGWGWALILAELIPQRDDAILGRGRDFGQSRLVCNVHWQSDIDAGRLVASATVARLHASPAFVQDMSAARAEIVNLEKRGPSPSGCSAEAEALAKGA